MFSEHIFYVIYATKKISIDYSVFLNVSTLVGRKYLFVADRSKFKKPGL